jgi:hypothetical protein
MQNCKKLTCQDPYDGPKPCGIVIGKDSDVQRYISGILDSGAILLTLRTAIPVIQFDILGEPQEIIRFFAKDSIYETSFPSLP